MSIKVLYLPKKFLATPLRLTATVIATAIAAECSYSTSEHNSK